jgi:hypothetical protein
MDLIAAAVRNQRARQEEQFKKRILSRQRGRFAGGCGRAGARPVIDQHQAPDQILDAHVVEFSGDEGADQLECC